jgi:hypothetical protein
MSQDKRVGSGLNLGLQIGTQFCPGMMNGNVNYRRRKIEFFCGLKAGANCWFFDIYIQGSKYNFKS